MDGVVGSVGVAGALVLLNVVAKSVDGTREVYLDMRVEGRASDYWWRTEGQEGVQRLEIDRLI